MIPRASSRTRKVVAIVVAGAAIGGTTGGLTNAIGAGAVPAAPVVRSAEATGPPTMSREAMPTAPVAYDFGETLSRLEGAELEITFLAAIIEHHAEGIEMARLELAKGVSPELRTLAESIIANQARQIESFTRRLMEWYGLTPEAARAQLSDEATAELAEMAADSERMMAEFAAAPAGLETDVAFAERIIPHHAAALIEFLELQGRAVHDELRVMAHEGTTMQQSEIVQFRYWLEAPHAD